MPGADLAGGTTPDPRARPLDRSRPGADVPPHRLVDLPRDLAVAGPLRPAPAPLVVRSRVGPPGGSERGPPVVPEADDPERRRPGRSDPAGPPWCSSRVQPRSASRSLTRLPVRSTALLYNRPPTQTKTPVAAIDSATASAISHGSATPSAVLVDIRVGENSGT
ncbi:hypothetical protein G443_002784 [Actinoalloteichus cyanogriseus DSM 43889]|uniref:Uncharacterized protein n=1 Tax=Actinoalloteichus caeruleus DSM 43889 TaxID=1120930 RepID=A0ABT1JJ23_ACTCY|nr:hypothetical protein [Actinoalloteichus caeruleus DSM 43889]